ncbi:hypothetical protein T265_11414 [Opisthorchis viverrini]|uniref:Uncharacterized protein n=1 Tax=Opisthorchis viverrini TaxID=6198 RepID=A0A074YZ23_OPIVI|nr:hypothetical protein T265_11414 [Opisthorchis viverrini]KER19923.1 hypothetical protein T265_11414 [Opisthorchis viverrini]
MFRLIVGDPWVVDIAFIWNQEEKVRCASDDYEESFLWESEQTQSCALSRLVRRTDPQTDPRWAPTGIRKRIV